MSSHLKWPIGNCVFRLMLSIIGRPKVMTLISFYCKTILPNVYYVKLMYKCHFYDNNFKKQMFCSNRRIVYTNRPALNLFSLEQSLKKLTLFWDITFLEQFLWKLSTNEMFSNKTNMLCRTELRKLVNFEKKLQIKWKLFFSIPTNFGSLSVLWKCNGIFGNFWIWHLA